MYGAYSFSDVSVQLMGLLQLHSPLTPIELTEDGVGEEGLTITPNSPRNKMIIGCNGNNIHELMEDRSVTVTISLMKMNPKNLILQDMANIQTASPLLHGQNILLISNLSTAELIICTSVAFRGLPEVKYKKETMPIDWVFDCAQAFVRLGGRKSYTT